ncbi:hypothetical protein ACOSP7_020999 [Xanthoceras sorbifolium]
MGEASLLPPLPSSTHNFLEQCAAKLPVECGVQIVGTLFGDGTLTASCCSSLVAVGRPCHDEFLAVTLPYHKEVDPSIVLAKSEKIAMLSPVLAAQNMGEASLLPPLPSSIHNFLEQCTAKLLVECGVQIVGTLIGDGTLTASCCSSLVEVGRPCHDEVLAVTLPYHKEVDPSIVLAKSEKVWNDCARKKPPAKHVE